MGLTIEAILPKGHKYKIAGALSGLAMIATKLSGDYAMFDKNPLEQFQNPEQLFNYGLLGLGSMFLLAAGTILDQRTTSENRDKYRDELTGALNRRYFNKTQENLRVRGAPKSQHAVAYIDLDDFKPINDTYGHAAGDEVLKEVYNILESSLRTSKGGLEEDLDRVIREGGDEFVILMPHTDRKGAEAVIKRMREKLKDFSYKGMQVGFSYGIGTHPHDLAQAKEEADREMYEDKAKKKVR